MQRVLVIMVALVLGGLSTLARLGPSERVRALDGYEDRYYLPAPAWLGVLSLGHREALADLIWCRTMIYYGDELTHQGSERHIFDYADAILALDPDFRSVYRRVGTLALYRGVAVTADEGERAVALMEQGAARYPDDGQLAWTTGASLAFELPPLYPDRPDMAERARERAAPYLVRAAQLGAAPPYTMLQNATLLARIGRAEEAATHLEEMYAMTDDVQLRDEIAARIEQLRSDAFASGFVEENARFENAWGQQMPYAPAALYDLVGPVPVIDTNAVLRDGFGAHALDGAGAFE